MSLKWQRTKAWDEEHLRGALLPLKWVLRTFSSITLAVTLLILVSLYGALASVPIGMLAQIPTVVVVGLSVAAALGVGCLLPAWLLHRVMRERGTRAFRFTAVLAAVLAFGAVTLLLWYRHAWPVLHYDPATGKGLRFFAGFVSKYGTVTIRRLPGLEMSELEFYSWWPLRAMLFLFICNMVVATARRIEFCFKNIGVLTVHTGIVTIALGSIYYAGLKREGDTILFSGTPAANGEPTPGRPQSTFFDNTEVALYVRQDGLWEQRPMKGVPRYNHYNLAAAGPAGGVTAWEASGRIPPWHGDPGAGRDGRGAGVLNIPVPSRLARLASETGIPPPVDPDIRFRIVGYATYAEPAEDWVRSSVATLRGLHDRPNPLRIVHLISELPEHVELGEARPTFSFVLLPARPAKRISDAGVFAIEYTEGMSEQRWRDLSAPIPLHAEHALVIEVPGWSAPDAEEEGAKGFREVYPVVPGARLAVGKTGYLVEVREILPQPPFPIITEGYKDSSSSVVVVRVTTPEGTNFERFIYHRFPEINQDILEGGEEHAMPLRRDADPAIRIGYIDATRIQVYLDDVAATEDAPARTRSIVRRPGAPVVANDELGPDSFLRNFVPQLSMRVAARWAHAEPLERPSPIPEMQRERDNIGNHNKAMLGVEVSLADYGAPAQGGAAAWSSVVWLPFTKYLGVGLGTERIVRLPDGREVELAFGRRQYPLPGFDLQLLDFKMIPYDHRGAPRDYQSLLRVVPSRGGEGTFETFVHVASLNAPLQAPFSWTEERGLLTNIAGRVRAGLSPNQYKFSQAGWDAEGWRRTQAQADNGQLPRAYAAFTILQVGNNPGIHVIALGAIMMGVGIPWAFYVKPWLVRRERKRIQAQVKAGTYVRPARVALEPVAARNGAVPAAAGSESRS